MTQFNATEIVQSISEEFFQVGDEVRISQRGLARLIGIDEKTIRRYVDRFTVRLLEVSKTLKGKLGKTPTVRLQTISLKDASACIAHYATGNDSVAKTIRNQAVLLLVAFAERGMQSWVRDVLGIQVDTTSTDADINTLVGLYPGLAVLSEQQTETMQTYITVRQYLTEVRHMDADSDAFKWMHQRLCLMGSQAYQSLKQTAPAKRLVYLAKAKRLVKQATYLYSELSILDMAYEKLLLAYDDYQVFLALDWVQMDGE